MNSGIIGMFISTMTDLYAQFENTHRSKPLMVRAPGRINLIGEHTDYNEGYVMPAAIDKAVFMAIAPSGSSTCQIKALDLGDTYTFNIHDDLHPVGQGWVNYLIGVVAIMKDQGKPIGGFDLIFTSDIPMGAGLSSSAALTCGLGFALNQLFDLGYPRLALVEIGQQTEQTFAGVQCGIMDQFACCFGLKNNFIFLDCSTLEWRHIPVELGQCDILLFDSKVKHELAGSEYNVRRKQCENAVAKIQKEFKGVNSLRDVTMSMLSKIENELTNEEYRRSEFIVEENQRVKEMANLLEAGNLSRCGDLLKASHDGLSKLYEVSCNELDLLADTANAQNGVFGARMMGGGFGGCTINLVDSTEVDTVIDAVTAVFEDETGQHPGIYHVSLDEGVSIID